MDESRTAHYQCASPSQRRYPMLQDMRPADRTASKPGERTKRKAPNGVATSDVILSAHVAGNADVFPQLLKLHVPKGSVVADVTWGKGVFWKNVPRDHYAVHPTDLETGVDCRAVPDDNES